MTATPLSSVGIQQTPFEPDVPAAQDNASRNAFGAALWSALNDAATAFGRAAGAESAFAHGRGGLAEMVFERAQADVVLAVATTAASRAAQSLSTIFNMQV